MPMPHEHELDGPDPLIGRTISGRYRVHSVLGQGGMGTVYQAQQIPLGRAVAVKVLSAGQVEPGFHKRFFQEAAILAKLKSPNTVTVFDYGRDEDIYFIAMELVSGEPLDRVLDNAGALPVPRALGIAQQVCRSLREAHAQGIVHRDLKPGNIVLTQGGDDEEIVKVLDFGLAKRVNRASEDTQRDTVPGSPRYMAPEVIRQQSIDGRSDMYGLGVLLYQMLTGVVPFERDSPMEILVAHLQEPPPPMREVSPAIEVPEAVERIVMRCLAKLPDDRYASMQELLDALRGLAGEIGVGSDPSWMRPTAMPGEATGSFATASRAPRLGGADSQLASPPVVLQQNHNRLFMAAGGVVLTGAIIAYLAVGSGSGAEAPAAAAPEPVPVGRVEGPRPVPGPPPPVAAAPEAVPAAVPPVAPQAPTTAAAAAPGAAPTAGAEVPAIHVHVVSQPPGATVLLDGKRIGTTPASFEWRDARAHVGGQIALVVRKPGYVAAPVRQAIDGAEVNVDVTLASDPNADPNLGPSAGDFDLRALQDRARALEQAAEAPPVMKITPSEPAAEEAAPAQE